MCIPAWCALQVHTPTANAFLVYFPMISPQSSLSFFLFCFVSARGTTPIHGGGWRNRAGNSNYPFETNVSRGDYPAPPLLSTFWLLRVVPFVWPACFCPRLSFGRETRCGNKGWFFCFFRGSCHELIVVLIRGVDLSCAFRHVGVIGHKRPVL